MKLVKVIAFTGFALALVATTGDISTLGVNFPHVY